MSHRAFKALSGVAWLVFALLSVVVAAYALTYLYGQPQVRNPLQAKFAASGLDVPAHLFGGGLALLLVPLQMSAWIQQRLPRLHRISGGLYAGGVVVAGVAGLSLALRAEGGMATGVAFGLLALAWLAATGIGIRYALMGEVSRHRQWMWRSIALTGSAISLRVILLVGLGVLHLPFPTAYLAAAWGCWLFNLALCELLLRWPGWKARNVWSSAG